MINRRGFLCASAGAFIAPFVTGCGLLDEIAQVPTTVSVNVAQLKQAVMPQQCEEWCWAASISMIFAFYGHPLSQAQIVAQTYGAAVCQSAQTITIGTDLSRQWVDNNGKVFTSQVIAAYDPTNGIANLNNAMLVNELSANHPLLYCNTHHAEVLYSVTYQGSANNPQVIEADVIDPWPFNPPAHPLDSSELVASLLGGEMTFLAAVRVS